MQALGLASMNCWSLGIMGVGGALWAFDISGLQEMRQSLRGHLGYEHFDKPSPEVDRIEDGSTKPNEPGPDASR